MRLWFLFLPLVCLGLTPIRASADDKALQGAHFIERIQCVQDDDCALLTDKCGDWAVNKKSLEEARAIERTCVKPLEHFAATTVKCVNDPKNGRVCAPVMLNRKN
jgi:hypothetical protein